MNQLSPPRRKRRASGFLVILPLALLVGGYAYWHFADERELAQVLAETDRLEPNGWNWEAIQAEQPEVSDDQNAAICVKAIRDLFPPKWPARDQKPTPPSLRQLSPEVQLSEEDTQELRADFRKEPGLKIVAAARELTDMPNLRFRLRWSKDDWIGPNLEDQQRAREIINVLNYDILLRAQEGDADGACRSCQAVVNISRAVAASPTLISHLIAGAGYSIVCSKVERLLAQGQPSETALAELQRSLERAEGEFSLVPAMRFERAADDHFCREVQGDKPSAAVLSNKHDRADSLAIILGAGSIAHNRAALIRYMNQVVTIARRPVEEHAEALAQLNVPKCLLARMILPAVRSVFEAHRRTTAALRSAIVIIAAERYRRKYSRWPATLDALVPEFIARVPTDPYDGQPLRYRRHPDGYAMYSVYLDGTDNDGAFDSSRPQAKGTDWGFRLWDPERRRQKPPTAKGESKP